MSSLTSRHDPVARGASPVPARAPLSLLEMGLVWFAILVAGVLAFHLVTVFGGAW